MADGTKIEWTDATWNPIVGCSVTSPGCTNCYAMRLAGTRLKHHPSRAGLTVDSKAGPVWTGETRFDEKALTQPLRWKRPRKIFVCAHSDLFHPATSDEWIDRVFAVMALCPQHTFQVLTKRPERMRSFITNFRGDNAFPTAAWPLPNVWLGVTAEDQTRADERIPVLLATPAAKRFVSVEPMLGKVSFAHRYRSGGYDNWLNGERWFPGAGSINSETVRGGTNLDWVICGGESGPGARPMHPGWVRSLRDQCAAAGVPFLFKQWGEWADQGPAWGTASGSAADLHGCHFVRPDGSSTTDREASGAGAYAMYREGKRAAGRLLDGIEHNEFPEA